MKMSSVKLRPDSDGFLELRHCRLEVTAVLQPVTQRQTNARGIRLQFEGFTARRDRLIVQPFATERNGEMEPRLKRCWMGCDALAVQFDGAVHVAARNEVE